MVICLEQGADLHMAQLMPLPLTVTCFSRIQIGFTFLVPAHPGSPGQRAVKRVCVCVCVCEYECVLHVGRSGRCVSAVGLSDYDHTRPSRHDRSSRSRSGDREKSQTPESSGRPRPGTAAAAAGRKTPSTPASASTGKKAGVGSKGKVVQFAPPATPDTTRLCHGCKQEAQLSPRDRAMRRVN